MKIFLSSTSLDLGRYRDRAREAIERLGHQGVRMEVFGARPERPLAASLAEVEACELFVGIYAHRYGTVPPGSEVSITEAELRRAQELGRPVFAFVIDEDHPWPPKLVEDEPGRSRIRSLKSELGECVVRDSFTTAEDLAFKVGTALGGYLGRGSGRTAARPGAWLDGARLKRAAELGAPPARPYPLLDPYRDPRTFGGRGREIETLLKKVEEGRLLLAVYAPSGAGKSSLLLAGLLPPLRQRGVPVAYIRYPAEARLATRIVEQLLKLSDQGAAAAAEEPWELVRALERARELGRLPPLIVLDQLEDCFKGPPGEVRRPLADLGPLLAATALAGGGRLCRWLLAYRQDAHGDVGRWLADPLVEARRAGREGLEALACDLTSLERLDTWPLPVLGERDAETAFHEAVEKPLRLTGGDGRALYDVRFAGDGSRRLVAAFAAARLRRPDAPLVPELQVVLHQLLEEAPVAPGEPREVTVPAEIGPLIDRALSAHLRRALEQCFPLEAGKEAAQQGRTRALLALGRLADAEGRRAAGGVAEGELLRALGAGGQEILALLGSPRMRVVVADLLPAGRVYRLSHDRLAGLVRDLLADETTRRDFGLDEELLRLRRLVDQRTRLHHEAADSGAVELDDELWRRIGAARDLLIVDDWHRAWWQACGEWRRRTAGRRRRDAIDRLRVALAAEGGSPAEAFEVLQRLLAEHGPSADLLAPLAEADSAQVARLFTEGPFRLPVAERPRAAVEVVAAVRSGLSNLAADRRLLGALLASLEQATLHDRPLRPKTTGLREELVASFRRAHPELPAPFPFVGGKPPNAVELRGGDFVIGADDDPENDEKPAHPVRLTSFWLAVHPVTNAEYRRFLPDHRPSAADDLPAVGVDWHEALAFCAWIGGWLPSEAQWERAARGAERRKYPWGPGEPTPLLANYASETLLAVDRHSAGATPEGIHEMAGSVWEWCWDWYGRYCSEVTVQLDPTGPSQGSTRTLRGGSWRDGVRNLRSSARNDNPAEERRDSVGFRVLWPLSS